MERDYRILSSTMTPAPLSNTRAVGHLLPQIPTNVTHMHVHRQRKSKALG